jgi:alpha-tubulin suppressor-like RCC1 family protein
MHHLTLARLGFCMVLYIALLSAGGCQSISTPSPSTQVWAWGANDFGQLGDGTQAGRTTPAAIPGLSDVRMIAASSVSSVALKGDGSVWQWGSLQIIPLPVGGTIPQTPCVARTANNPEGVSVLCDLTPVTLKDDSGRVVDDVRKIAAGGFHILATRTNDNFVVGWGQSFFHQLAIGFAVVETLSPMKARTDVQLEDSGVHGIVSVSAGSEHSLALRSGPPRLTAWAWGSNEGDQVGHSNLDACGRGGVEPAVRCQNTQFEVPGLAGPVDVIGIAAGGKHNVVLKVDGTVWTWGDNFFGQLGLLGSLSTSASPLQVMTVPTSAPFTPSPFTGVKDVAAGGSHTLALKNDGTVWAWGDHRFGQTGTGTPQSSFSVVLHPTQVRGPGGVGFLTDVVAIAAGARHSLAATRDGRVHAWGDNRTGQLGVPSSDTCTTAQTPCSLTPVFVGTVPASVTRISAGGSHSLALVTLP